MEQEWYYQGYDVWLQEQVQQSIHIIQIWNRNGTTKATTFDYENKFNSIYILYRYGTGMVLPRLRLLTTRTSSTVYTYYTVMEQEWYYQGYNFWLREQVQQYINIIQIWSRNGTTKATTFNYHSKRMEKLVMPTNLVFYSPYNASTLFRDLQMRSFMYKGSVLKTYVHWSDLSGAWLLWSHN